FGLFSDRFGRKPAFTSFSFLTAAAVVPLAYFWQGEGVKGKEKSGWRVDENERDDFFLVQIYLKLCFGSRCCCSVWVVDVRLVLVLFFLNSSRQVPFFLLI